MQDVVVAIYLSILTRQLQESIKAFSSTPDP